MHRIAPFLLIVTVVVLAVFIYRFFFFSPVPTETPGTDEKLTLAIALQPIAAIPLLAQSQGFFEAEGITVEFKAFPSGKRALNEGLFTGEADMATSTEIPVTVALMEERPLVILASVGTADNINRIIARKDRGIKTPSDLKGKTVATQHASAVHYFLTLFLQSYAVSDKKTTLRFMKAEALPEALAKGEIDAFSMREPYISQAKERLGENAVIFGMPGLYIQSELLVTTRAFNQNRPETVRKVLKALSRAEAYAKEHPAEAIESVASMLNIPSDIYEKMWEEIVPRVRLDQSLLILLESQARWILDNTIVPGAPFPNCLEAIEQEALRAVRPDAVTIIR